MIATIPDCFPYDRLTPLEDQPGQALRLPPTDLLERLVQGSQFKVTEELWVNGKDLVGTGFAFGINRVHDVREIGQRWQDAGLALALKNLRYRDPNLERDLGEFTVGPRDRVFVSPRVRVDVSEVAAIPARSIVNWIGEQGGIVSPIERDLFLVRWCVTAVVCS